MKDIVYELVNSTEKLSTINSESCSTTDKAVQDFGRENLKEETSWKTAQVGGIACVENGVMT